MTSRLCGMSRADDLGIPFVRSEWPHGLKCTNCRHAFREGERFTTRLDALSEDGVPVCLLVCLPCYWRADS
jgi:hypothetical protein